MAHAQLIDCNGSVVHEFHPSYHSSCHAFEAPYVATGSTHFTEIHAHAAAELAHHCKVVDTAIDAFQAVWHGVDEATGKLMIGLARIGKRRCRHCHLQTAKHFVELPHPLQPPILLRHGEVQGYTQVHFLHRLHRFVRVSAYEVAFVEEVESRVVEQFVTFGAHECRSFLYFLS